MRQRSHCGSKDFVYFSSLKFDKAENQFPFFPLVYMGPRPLSFVFLPPPQSEAETMAQCSIHTFSCIPQTTIYMCVLFNASTHILFSMNPSTVSFGLDLVHRILNPNSQTQQDTCAVINISHYFTNKHNILHS